MRRSGSAAAQGSGAAAAWAQDQLSGSRVPTAHAEAAMNLGAAWDRAAVKHHIQADVRHAECLS